MYIRGTLMKEKKTWEVGVARIISGGHIEGFEILAALARIEAKLDHLLARRPLGKRLDKVSHL